MKHNLSKWSQICIIGIYKDPINLCICLPGNVPTTFYNALVCPRTECVTIANIFSDNIVVWFKGININKIASVQSEQIKVLTSKN